MQESNNETSEFVIDILWKQKNINKKGINSKKSLKINFSPLNVILSKIWFKSDGFLLIRDNDFIDELYSFINFFSFNFGI